MSLENFICFKIMMNEVELTHHSLHGRIWGTKHVSPTNSDEEEVQTSWGDLDFIYAESGD